MPVAVTCRSCSGNQMTIIRQKDALVQRCLRCNRIWPFGPSNDRGVFLDIEAARFMAQGNLTEMELVGSLAWQNDQECFATTKTARRQWEIGWLGRAGLEIDPAAEQVESLKDSLLFKVLLAEAKASTELDAEQGAQTVTRDPSIDYGASIGRSEMERIWKDIQRQSDEQWKRDVNTSTWSGRTTDEPITGLPDVVTTVTEDERTP